MEVLDTEQFMPPVEYETKWRNGPPQSMAKFLLPKDTLVSSDGGFDIMFHFHGGQVTDTEWRNTGINAAIVAVTLGQGSAVYADAFADDNRLWRLVEEVTRAANEGLPKKHKRAIIRRIGLLSWSAGYGATQQILTQTRFDDLIDSVVLLDGLHADYENRAT